MAARPWDDGSYFLVCEPEEGRFSPQRPRVATKGGDVLTRRFHGSRARLDVVDESEAELPVATWLRAAAAVGQELALLGPALDRPMRVRLAPSGPDKVELGADGIERVDLEGPSVARAPIHHPVHERARALLTSLPWRSTSLSGSGPLPPAARRVLFFESLMNSDMPHNDCELSQGVLHMASTLAKTESEAVLANVKMSIQGSERPVQGLESLERAFARGPLDLVCITLLEGYWDGVVALIAELRKLGCRAHVAVGGVMPTLTPEHVAAHLPDVSFVCRGAGEYFVPRLARIVGTQSSIDRPFTPEQRSALLGMDGLIALDRAGRRLISANSAHSVRVESLESVELDLRLLERRHLEQGVELSTSRGCIHKCSFCSIIGRQSYQSRSAGGVLALLDRYQERYRELFGDAVPGNAHRLHISDDDFACDKPRARKFFENILATPFRLASVQVSVADLCARRASGLAPEPDPEIVDAIRPECFADSAAAIPTRDYVADHRSRNWSSYLQIGVETSSDRELDRLGKGYGVEHVRAIVAEMSRRQIHVDAYLILANSDTSAEDLSDSIEELCRLKLRHPKWFHVRFPIVPRLVSYFPSASYRRLLRNGRGDSLRLRGLARVPGHPELDYPFVDADEPLDPWVRAVDASVFTDRGFYTATLEALRQRFLERCSSSDELTPERERVLRRLDDAPRQLVFEMLREARSSADAAAEQRAVATALELLGSKQSWLPAFKRSLVSTSGRLTAVLSAADGIMGARTLERAIDLLASSRSTDLVLRFAAANGPGISELVQRGVAHAVERGASLGKRIQLVLVSDGSFPDDEHLRWLSQLPVRLETSLGLGFDRGHVAERASAIQASGLPHETVLVVQPSDGPRLAQSFGLLASTGVPRIRVECAVDAPWSAEQAQAFAEGLHRVGEELRARRARGERLELTNLEAPRGEMRRRAEITVECDGRIHSGGEPLGHLDDYRSFDRYVLDSSAGDSESERALGAVLSSFVRWMKSVD